MEQIYERHLREMTQDRPVSSPSALEKAKSAIGVGVRIPPSDAILQTIDESLKRLHAATEALAEKLQPLNGERPMPEPGPGDYQTEVVSYAHASSLMTGLEDRALQIDEVAARLSHICARTEL